MSFLSLPSALKVALWRLLCLHLLLWPMACKRQLDALLNKDLGSEENANGVLVASEQENDLLVAGLGLATAAGASAEVGDGFVLRSTAVRLQPTEAKEIVDANDKKLRKSNTITTLYRGEQLEVEQRVDANWYRVRLSDGSSGYVLAAHVLVQRDSRLATVLEDAKYFSRPDILTMSSNRSVLPGSLLFVLRQKDSFSEVDIGSAQTVWMLTKILCFEQEELIAAKWIQKANQWRGQGNETEADAAIEAAKKEYPKSRLLNHLFPPEAVPAAALEQNTAVGSAEALGEKPSEDPLINPSYKEKSETTLQPLEPLPNNKEEL